jgi:AhpD family alkylhydroperoxidase
MPACSGGGDGLTTQKTLAEIKETFGFVPGFFEDFKWDELALSGGWELFKKFELGETNIPPKYRHMIALATAAAIKCPYCTRFHKAAAELFGATETELQETALTGSLVGYFSNYLHGRHYPIEKFEEELEPIGKNLSAGMK